MTSFHYEKVQCPYCLNEEDIAIWDVVDVSEDSDLKDKIYLKELQVFACQNCNRKYTLDQPFLYIDPNEKLLIYYAPKFYTALDNEDSRDGLGSLKTEISSEMPLDFGIDVSDHTLRIVTDYNDLIEKLHSFDFGLNDRVVEILKIAVAMNPPASTDETGNTTVHAIDLLYFVGIEDEQYAFQTFTQSDETWRQIVLDASVYKSAEDLVKGKIPGESQWDIVDNLGAKMYLNNMSQ